MKALVTGGGGFLGRRIVELLIDEGHEVHFLARGRYPEVEALGATGHQVDLRDAEALRPILDGVDTVFHVAAKAGYWGDRESYFSTNLDGTSNLLDAMRAAGAKRMVFTSTPSVIGYAEEVEGITEAPYPETHESFYPASKAAAEKVVLAANGEQIATVSLRPHLIIGPGDNNLLPRVVARAKTGKLVVVGDGQNKVDLTYIDNAAWAHLDAARALKDHTAPCAGKAYFISNDEPVVLWDWMNAFLPRVGAPAVNKSLSHGAARTVGAVMEFAYNTLPLKGEPRMTRYLASALARSHWYDMEPAKRDFGYTIRVSMDEATTRTVEWFNRAT